MVYVIDVGVGNISSITNWLFRGNVAYKVIDKPRIVSDYDVILLPGVGSVETFLNGLRRSKLDRFIIDANSLGIRIIGICLGAQVLFEYLEEDGGREGFGFIKGQVKKLDGVKSNTGWSEVSLDFGLLSPAWRSVKVFKGNYSKNRGRVFYNHSYGIFCEESCNMDVRKNFYGMEFSSVVHKENIIAFQFHPEKSQDFGDILLKKIF